MDMTWSHGPAGALAHQLIPLLHQIGDALGRDRLAGPTATDGRADASMLFPSASIELPATLVEPLYCGAPDRQ